MRRQSLVLLVVGILACLTLFGVGSAVQSTVEADLLIEQPMHVEDSVQVEDTGNGTLYHVDGKEFRIWLQSADHSNVTGWGIADGAGDLEYDQAKDYYRFIPDSNGTMTLYWTVAEGNGTVRQEATVRVESTDFVTTAADQHERLTEQASRYREIEQETNRLDPETDTDEVISEALTLYRFFESPLSTFFSDIQGTIIILTLRPGGLAVLGVLLLGFLGTSYTYMRKTNRYEKQLRDEHELEAEKREVFIEKSRQIFQQNDWVDLFPDDTAKAMERTLHKNPWLGFKQYLQLRSPEQTKGTILQFMGQVGYEGRVRRLEGGSVKEAWVVGPDDSGETGAVAADGGEAVETVDLCRLQFDDDDDRAIIRAIPGSDLDLSIFDRPERLNPQEVRLPIDNRDIDDSELFEALQPRFPEDFEDEEHFARCFGTLFQFVQSHPYYSDGNGYIDDGQDLLSFMAEMDTILADEADFPVAEGNRRMLFFIADEMDIGAKLEHEIEKVEREGYTE